LTVTASGEVAVGFAGELLVMDGEGTLVGQTAGLFPLALAAPPSGGIVAAVEDPTDPDFAVVMPYNTDGTPGGDQIDLPGYYRTHLDVDSGGAVVSSTSGHSQVTIARLAADGFEHTEEGGWASFIESGVAVDGDSNVIVARDLNDFENPAGALIYALSSTGDPLWSLERPAMEGMIGSPSGSTREASPPTPGAAPLWSVSSIQRWACSADRKNKPPIRQFNDSCERGYRLPDLSMPVADRGFRQTRRPLGHTTRRAAQRGRAAGRSSGSGSGPGAVS
jgi:hypothetical protein